MVRRSVPLRVLLLILAITPLFTDPQTARAQEGGTRWQALGAPGGRVTLLAASQDGETVYAVSVAEVNRNPNETQSSEGGTPTRADALYKSSDAGQNWTAVTNDLPPGEITLLFVDADGAVWAGAQPWDGAGTLWRSADEGATWRAAQLGRDDLLLRDLAQDADGDLLLLATSGDAAVENWLYSSAGDGSWSPLRLDLPGAPAGAGVASIDAHPTEPRLYLTTDSGDLLLSSDGGQVWTAQGERPQDALALPAQFALLPDQPDVALLARPTQAGFVIQRSRDSGATWTTLSARGLPGEAISPGSLVAAGNGVVLMPTDHGVYRSADGGNTWQALEGALDSGFVYALLPLSGGDALLAGTAYGLFASSDRGALWRQSGAGLPHNSPMLGLLTHPDRPEQILAYVRAVGAPGASLLLVSRDGGGSWLPAGPGGAWTDATAWAMDSRNPDRLYIAGASYVAASRDGGVTWDVTEMPSNVPRTAIAVAPSDPQRVYVDGAPRLVSDDGGERWRELPIHSLEGGVEIARGVAVDPADADHVWFGLQDGVRESRDGGETMQRTGLDGPSIRWLATVAKAGGGKDFDLFAGTENDGIMRRAAGGQDWQPARAGLPPSSNIVAFAADPQTPDLLWATRDGGGIYASGDSGATWQNAGRGSGDNLGLSIAPNYGGDGGWFAGTANAGLWLLGPERPAAGGTPTPPGPTSAPAERAARSGVDARIEVVWPHDFAPLQEATLANVGIRLFLPASLESPACGWRPAVELWRAVNTDPAGRVELAEQRAVDGQPFPYWDANDVDVSPARADGAKVYFLVKVDGVDTATSVWAHGADARTYFPEQLVPSGIATGAITEVDARIQIVWPHDETGAGRDVSDAPLANVGVTLFKRGTRLSVPAGWQPPGEVRLMGAWDSEVARPFEITPVMSSRQSGVIAYPVWEFNDVPVDRARDGSRLYVWAEVDGVRSYPTLWAHGADSRTYFPAKDEPVMGCLP